MALAAFLARVPSSDSRSRPDLGASFALTPSCWRVSRSCFRASGDATARTSDEPLSRVAAATQLSGRRAGALAHTHTSRADALARRSLARVIKSLSTEIEKLEQAVRQALEALPEAAQLAQAAPASRGRRQEDRLGANGGTTRVRAFDGQTSSLRSP